MYKLDAGVQDCHNGAGQQALATTLWHHNNGISLPSISPSSQVFVTTAPLGWHQELSVFVSQQQQNPLQNVSQS